MDENELLALIKSIKDQVKQQYAAYDPLVIMRKGYTPDLDKANAFVNADVGLNAVIKLIEQKYVKITI